MLKKIDELTAEEIASVCDHTYLNRPEAFRGETANGQSPIKVWERDLNNFLEKTIQLPYKPYCVCVRPETVSRVFNLFNWENINEMCIASVAGFPYAQTYTFEQTINEAKEALKNGASEIDYVLDHNKMRGKESNYFSVVLPGMANLGKDRGIKTKLILETSELTNEEIEDICKYADKIGFDFVKTSTGFSSAGAKVEHLRIMKNYFSRGVKISGGVN